MLPQFLAVLYSCFCLEELLCGRWKRQGSNVFPGDGVDACFRFLVLMHVWAQGVGAGAHPGTPNSQNPGGPRNRTPTLPGDLGRIPTYF